MGDELNPQMIKSPFLCVLALREILIVRIYDCIYQEQKASSGDKCKISSILTDFLVFSGRGGASFAQGLLVLLG